MNFQPLPVSNVSFELDLIRLKTPYPACFGE